MLSSSLDALLKLSKTTSAKQLFDYDNVTLYLNIWILRVGVEVVPVVEQGILALQRRRQITQR